MRLITWFLFFLIYTNPFPLISDFQLAKMTSGLYTASVVLSRLGLNSLSSEAAIIPKSKRADAVI
jgi:hypothetical protein